MKLFSYSNTFYKLVLFLVCGFMTQHSQALLSYGPKIGMQMTSMVEKNAAGTAVTGLGYGTSWVAGAGFDVGAGPLGVVFDLLVQNRRISFDNTHPGFLLAPGDLSGNFIHIPVQARFGFGLFYATGGLYWSKLFGNYSVPTGATFDVNNLKSSDSGFVAGLGLKIPMAVVTPTLEIRTNWGLSNGLIAPNADAEVKFRQFEVLIGALF